MSREFSCFTLTLKQAMSPCPHRACLGGIGLLHYEISSLEIAIDVVQRPENHRGKLGGVTSPTRKRGIAANFPRLRVGLV